MRRRIYFAHPISDYGSDREQRAIAILEAAGFEVENPADEEHVRQVEVIKASAADRDEAGRDIMAYFVSVAVDCDALAFQAFPHDMVGAGVAKEVQAFEAAWQGSRPVFEVYEISRGGNERRTALLPCPFGGRTIQNWRSLGVEETRKALKAFMEQEKGE